MQTPKITKRGQRCGQDQTGKGRGHGLLMIGLMPALWLSADFPQSPLCLADR